MPIVSPSMTTLIFRHGMNAQTLINRVTRRIPSYDPSEYLDEINAAYKECWDYILQLDDSYFTDIKVVSIAGPTAAAEVDLMYNSNDALSGPVGNGVFQIDRIRIVEANDSNGFPAYPRSLHPPK